MSAESALGITPLAGLSSFPPGASFLAVMCLAGAVYAGVVSRQRRMVVRLASSQVPCKAGMSQPSRPPRAGTGPVRAPLCVGATRQGRRPRRKARAIAIRDPALARQLGIGRPDLRRDYDDGGLVDANSAPAAVLAALPGMTPELAGKAVELRAVRGPFVSADDLPIALGLRSDLLPALADVTVYPA